MLSAWVRHASRLTRRMGLDIARTKTLGRSIALETEPRCDLKSVVPAKLALRSGSSRDRCGGMWRPGWVRWGLLPGALPVFHWRVERDSGPGPSRLPVLCVPNSTLALAVWLWVTMSKGRSISRPAFPNDLRIGTKPHCLYITGLRKDGESGCFLLTWQAWMDIRVGTWLCLIRPIGSPGIQGRVDDWWFHVFGRQMFRHFSCTASSAIFKINHHPQPPQFFLVSLRGSSIA